MPVIIMHGSAEYYLLSGTGSGSVYKQNYSIPVSWTSFAQPEKVLAKAELEVTLSDEQVPM